MPIQGAVSDRVKAIIPVTWNALENDARIGDSVLQSAINIAKASTTGVVVDPIQESNYAVVVVDYIAKLAAIEIANAGIDFWMNQSISLSSTGTNENITYIDRASALDEQRKEWINETRLKQPEISKLVGYWVDGGHPVPQMSSANINPFHLTPSPEEMPRPYRQTQYS